MITLKNISAQYHQSLVLQNINLCILKHDFITIVGPNGSGKSTLLKILAGQMPVCGGSILLNNTLYRSLTPKQLAVYIAYYPQMRPIPNMRVQTLVEHGRFPHLGFGHVMSSFDEEKVLQAMQITQIYPLKERFIQTLSGGEKQRVFLAMLIAQDTHFILLDEPTAYLDIFYQVEMMEILKKLNEMGKTIVLVSHDLPSAFTFSKRVIVLNKGKIVADKTPFILEKEAIVETVFGFKIKKISHKNDDLLYPYALLKPE